MDGSGSHRRTSAVIGNETRYLCTCIVHGCRNDISQNPYNDTRVTGNWLRHSALASHLRADRIAALLDRRLASVSSVENAIRSLGEDSTLVESEAVHDIGVDVPPMGADYSDPSLVETSLDDMSSLLDVITRAALGFSASAPLVFVAPPGPNSPPYHPSNDIPAAPNAGPFRLSPSSPRNEALLAHEASMYALLHLIEQYELPQYMVFEDLRIRIRQIIVDEIQRISDVKAREWNFQRTHPESASAHAYSYKGKDRRYIDCARHHRHSQLGEDSALATASFLVLVLNLLCRVSRKKCDFVLAALRLMLSQIQSRLGANAIGLGHLPLDFRTVLHHFDLDPDVEAYVCCPTCFCLYNEHSSSIPDLCTSTTFTSSASRPCGTPLFETRLLKGSKHLIAVRKYLHQDFASWHARLLARPDIEAALDRGAATARSASRNEDRVVRDILESRAVQDFVGPDGSRFVDAPQEELRFIWGLGFDSFSPHGMKPGRPSSGSSALYAVLLSLPPDLRFLEENMFLIGIIPGPNKPSLDQIDHFTKLIVDDMLKFWEPGIYFSQTALYPTGRFALGALLPMICDLSAARQMSGFASHSATYFCSVCHLKQDQIEQIDKHQWSYRSVEEHRRQAEVWRSLDSDAARKAHIKHGFARHTEFLRLPYWDSVRFTVVESMHAHYLNNLKHHIRDTWGMSAKHQSGDGVLWYARKVPACSQKTNAVSWNRILQHLERDTVDQLTKLKYGQLWHLCLDRDLRRAGTKRMLAERLIHWRAMGGTVQYADESTTTSQQETEQPRQLPGDSASVSSLHLDSPHPFLYNTERLSLTEDSVSSSATPTSTITPEDRTRSASATPTSRGAPESRGITVSADDIEKGERGLRKGNKHPNVNRNVLVEMCMKRGIRTDLSMQDMWKQLKEWNEDQLEHDADEDQDTEPEGSYVLGLDVLQEIWSDQQRTLLPSCVAPAPTRVGSQKRTLKADEWRSLGTIHLVISLVRLWRFGDERQQAMLDNFIHLVSAIAVAGLHSTSHDHIIAYDHHYQTYLQGFLDLYKEVPLTPSNHMAQHFADKFLAMFGPSHSIRAWAMERVNNTLHNFAKNGKWGELEMTMMFQYCRAANIRALLGSDGLADELAELRPAFDEAFKWDFRGTRMNAIMGFGDAARMRVREFRGDMRLLASERQLVVSYLGTPDLRGLVCCSLLRMNAFSCRPFTVSDKDANIIIRRSGLATAADLADATGPELEDTDLAPAQIVRILWRKTTTPSVRGDIPVVFLIVRRHKLLDSDAQINDPYRGLGFAIAGRLFQGLYENFELIRAKSVVCPFARTEFTSSDPSLSKDNAPTVHVLPLVRDLHWEPTDAPVEEEDELSEV